MGLSVPSRTETVAHANELVSSSTGLLFELGPCRITNDGLNTTYNPHSWNEHANVIFLDQPVNVGYSYSSDGSTVSTSPVAGQDVHAFLELFISRFEKYADLPFHLVAESYGGTYGPNIASIIHRKNQALAFAPTPGLRPINLASLILANGLTDPYFQLPSIVDYACEGPYPVYSDPEGPECKSLRTKVPTCQRMVKACYDFSSRLTCVPAAVYCYAQIFRPIQQTGVNPYDVRKTCDPSEDGDMCYREMGWIDIWMNDPTIKAELGVDPTREFESCSEKVNEAFWLQGDGMHNSAARLPELINNDIRLLIYAGHADAACNFMGNERWLSELDHKFHKEFAASKSTQWIIIGSGRVAGEVRSAGGGGFGAGNATFVNIHEAGFVHDINDMERGY
ncbi:hypothetical protein EWM64_g7153 [Hericium alpestre]|uniref:Carboxypeptidase n=1 Tax=Hericium alpestre TaxID=135208 RepID=A0A4Y9ZSR8_9AGAM|nr:hypothetical protein EWM64_g7153 [Hericium alpestre]